MSIQPIKEKNLLTAQIKTIFLPDQRTALEQLLANVKYKIRSLRKSEKSRKRRWLVKKAKNDFKSNPYNAGKNLLDPKCYVNLKVKEEDLDQHKSSSLIDINYDVPLADLEGLPHKPLLQKFFQLIVFLLNSSFKYYLHGEMHQLLGLMEYPIKSTKNALK